MNVILDAIDEHGRIFMISVDMIFYEVEQDDKFCIIRHKEIEDRIFCVDCEFMLLHALSNGFDVLTELN